MSTVKLFDSHAQLQRLEPSVSNAIQGVLSHGQFILGPEVLKFEKLMSEFCGAKHVLGCANGTDALVIALRVLGIGPGHAVFVPAFTFAATAEAVCLVGAVPVFVDVTWGSFNLDLESLQEAYRDILKTGRLHPRAVIAVDLFGLPADYDKIECFCRINRLNLICDAAQSFGASLDGRKVGNFGDITTTSFFPAKPLGCYGDGGAVITNDSELATLAASIRVHGKGEDKYDNVRVGMNSRLDTVQAAILIEKLAVLEDELQRRNSNAAAYIAALEPVAEVPKVPVGVVSAWAQFTIKSARRDSLAATLRQNGIESAIYYPKPLHQQAAYLGFPVAPAGVPTAERLSAEVLSIPVHPYLTSENISQITQAIHGFATKLQ